MKKFYSLLLAGALAIANLVPVSAKSELKTGMVSPLAPKLSTQSTSNIISKQDMVFYPYIIDVAKQNIKLNTAYGQNFELTLLDDLFVDKAYLEYKKPDDTTIQIPLTYIEDYEEGDDFGGVYTGKIDPKDLQLVGLYKFNRLVGVDEILQQEVAYTRADFTAAENDYFDFSVVSQPKAVTGVTFNQPSKIVLQRGATAEFNATFQPEDAFYFENIWYTSNKFVVDFVSGVGKYVKVKGMKPGKSTLSFQVTTETQKNVTFAKTDIIVPGVILNKSKATIAGSGKLKLSAQVMNEDGTTTAIWKSSNTKVVKVDKHGNVTAVAPGKADIIVTTKDGKYSDKCTVTVNKVKVKTVKLNKTKLTLKRNKKAKLAATINPTNVTDKRVKWTSSKPKIVSVDQNGNIVAKKKGTATITAITLDGNKKATCKVTVK